MAAPIDPRCDYCKGHGFQAPNLCEDCREKGLNEIRPDPIAWQWRALESGEPRTSWYPVGYGDMAGWQALAKRSPDKYRVETRPLFASPPKPEGIVDALRDIAAERQRQIESEGWTPEHDDKHDNAEMAWAAAAYSIGLPRLSGSVQFGKRFLPWLERLWPWDLAWWKPTDRRRNLVKAGALILAEIERLDRVTAASKAGSGECV